MTRTCPDCRCALVTERSHDVDIDVCPECAGIWFDAEELRRLIASDPVSLIALEEKWTPLITQKKREAGVVACPTCDSLLRIYHYQYDSPIELNACDDCGGFWVQEGELQKMQQWRSEHAKPNERETLGIALAHAEMEHERALARLEGIRWFCGVLRQHKPLWLNSKG